jgi:hypothetical protein
MLPWHVESLRRDVGVLILRSWTCDTFCRAGKEECQPCGALWNHRDLSGIIERMKTGVHENTPLAYHGTGGLVEIARRKDRQIRALRLKKMKTDRLVARYTSQLDNCKWEGHQYSYATACCFEAQTECSDNTLSLL